MEDRELIQVNVQLPVEALHQFTMLIEQLRRLSEAAGGGPEHAASPAREQAESAVFDPERFQLLSREPKTPESARPPQSAAQEEAPAVRRAVQREVPPPESAGAPVSAAAPEPGAMYPDTAEAGHAGAEAVRLEPSAREAEEPPDPPEREDRPADSTQAAAPQYAARELEAKGVRAVADTPVPDAPAVRLDPASQIPAAETVWEEAQERELEAPALRAEPGPAAETPLGAGIVVSAGADGPPGRQAVMAEELVVPGAAPLTAEAVSLAFRRDGRRYDNGFPLY